MPRQALPGPRPSSPGWISGVGVEGILFCLDPLLCPEMESGKKARGVLAGASLCLPSSASSEDRGSGGPGGWPADGGAGLGRWLTLRVAAGLLRADWRGEGRLFPSHHSFHLLLPSALPICMSLVVSRSLKALPLPQLLGPASPCLLSSSSGSVQPPPRSPLVGNLCPTPEPHSHP